MLLGIAGKFVVPLAWVGDFGNTTEPDPTAEQLK